MNTNLIGFESPALSVCNKPIRRLIQHLNAEFYFNPVEFSRRQMALVISAVCVRILCISLVGGLDHHHHF
jgi:hypothetical protein